MPEAALRRPLVVAALCALAFAASGLFVRVLRAPDEIRVAEIGREMGVSGDFITPRLNGEPFLEQPPLAYAAGALAWRLLGTSDAAARVPAALCALATLLLVFGMARRLGGTQAALLAVPVLVATTGFHRYATSCFVDGPLMLAVTLGQAAWLALLEPSSRDAGSARLHPGAVLLLHVAAGLAFLVKGAIGPGLLYGPLLVDLLWHRRWSLLRSGWHVLGVAAALALVAAWPLALYLSAPDLAARYWHETVLGRLLPDYAPEGGHHQSVAFYFGSAPGMLAPWLLAAPALVAWLRRAPDDVARRPGTRAVAWILPLGLLLLSVPSTKRSLYLLPLVPAASLACALWLDSTRRRDLGRLETLTLLTLAAPLALPAELPARAWGALRGTHPDPFGVRPLLASLRRGAPAAAAPRVTAPRLAWAAYALVIAWTLTAGRNTLAEDEMTPMALDLARLGAVGDALVGFHLDERTRAIVPLRTGALFENVEDPEEVATRLDARPGARLLYMTKSRRRLPEELLAGLRPAGLWRFGRHEYELLDAAADETRAAGSTSR